jgi:hypothetical protein
MAKTPTSEPVEPGRWAIIQRFEQGEDQFGAREQIVSVSLMSPPGKAPDMPGVRERDRRGNPTNARDKYSAEQVPSAVVVGMIRGGSINAVGGFGFPDPNGRFGDRRDGPGGRGFGSEGATRFR